MKKTKEAKENLAKLSKADLHIHTNLSDGRPSIREVVDWVNKKTDLAVIAIADHDEIKGAYEARDLVKKKGYPFEVIIGEEVTAKEGHVLGLFLKERIRPGMSAKETIQEIHRQGGIAIAAHPLFRTRRGNPKYDSMDGVGAVTLIKEAFDGVETINATPTFGKNNREADYINQALLEKPETGSSDAHIKEAIGMSYTLFEGKTAEDFRRSFENKLTQAHQKKWTSGGIINYLLYYIPSFFKNIFWSLSLGFLPKEPKIIKVPKDFK
ncbi:PHP domain-containing protein [candidate division WS5 bacterium]|uniref:PHP domain-containing protein n=1 Tax=candidate division WS5 bacterium TaxID=2093353 RepID=A0A419DEH5_9BACT|nr:MAG: PHP domain-containing protein [candidate division WS5 bacterium]